MNNKVMKLGGSAATSGVIGNPGRTG